MIFHSLALVGAFAIHSVLAQVAVYGQCGGTSYTGSTVCVSGATCVYQNQYYSQCLPSSASTGSSPTTTSSASNAAPTGTFSQPVIYQDLADLDIINVNGTYYYSASTMHFSPGAPILRSYDLVNWEYIAHSVPSLNFGDNDSYNLVNGKRAYIRGIWASTLRFRPNTNTWIWLGCVDFAKTYIYTANSVTGPWNQAAVLNTCYYDCGMLVDDDGTMYVAYGSYNISVAQLSSDGLSQVKTQLVYSSSFYIEGSRFYKRDGAYYILNDEPSTSEWVLKSTSGPFGPYTQQPMIQNVGSPFSGGDNPHQGGIVEASTGNWYYMAFVDAYPGGRVPVLAPVTWSSSGWPSVTLASGNNWGTSYSNPLPLHPVSPLTGTDTFTSIGPQWEWNHNPDTTKFSIANGGGLVLHTATVTSDLYAARNTITHRTLGPKSSGTVLLDVSGMTDGDRAGISLFRDSSAWIGVQQTGSTRTLVMVNGLSMNSDWTTNSTGSVNASGPNLSGTQVYLRVTADINPGGSKTATFSYSTNGSTFTNLGATFTMTTDWQFFMGYRFAIFNFATKALGGSVVAKSFTIANA